MTQDSNSSFIVRFVAADRGVKSEARVQGRIAFPSNRGSQPKAGEFWRVTIQGENPKKTVFFLTCIEQVEQPADYQSPKVENKPSRPATATRSVVAPASRSAASPARDVRRWARRWPACGRSVRRPRRSLRFR